LIVEDETHLAESLGLLLEEYDVTIALSGRRALDLCSEREFDLILCDLLMPGLGGKEIYDELRRLHPGQEERIVFMTGGAFTPAAQEFLTQIPNRTLEKPFATEVLLQLVRAIRQGKGSARSAE
jgi:DNA-binding response OmpR family regulator